MYFLIVLGIIFLISLLLAFRSLKQLTRIEEVGSVKKELKKGKVLFYKDHSSSDDSLSSSSSSSS